MKNKILILYLAGLSAFAPVSTDIYIASMPTIERYFGTTAAKVQLTLSLFFVSFAIMQLLWGPLSDRIGRKPVIPIGLIVYIIGSLLCAFSHSIGMLIFARMIQAAGACCGIVMALAIIKDTYTQPKRMAKILGLVMSIMVIAPIIAPIIGSYLLAAFNWQANFYFLTGYAILLFVALPFFKESYPKSSRKPLPASQIVNAYRTQLFCWPFFLALFALSANFGMLFSFVAAVPFVYISTYGLPAHLFGYFFAFNAAGIITGRLVIHRLNLFFTSKQIIYATITLAYISAVVMLIAISLQPYSIWCVAIPAFFITLSFGIAFPELTTHALQNVIGHTGIASSLLGSIRYIFGAMMGLLTGVLVVGSPLPLPVMFLALNSLSFTCVIIYFKNKTSNDQKRETKIST